MDDSQTTRVSLLLRLQGSADRQAWSDFVDIYSPILYGFARRHGLQDADAADLVQEVLLSVSKSIRHYDRQRGPFRHWLMAVVRNRLSEFWQGRGRQASGSGDTDVLKHLEQVPSGEAWLSRAVRILSGFSQHELHGSGEPCYGARRNPMSDPQNCPGVTRLQALLDGTLPEETQAVMATHLESCVECRRQLELLAGGNVALPKDATPPERPSPALEQAMLRLKGEMPEETQTTANTHTGPLSFAFLSASDNPRHLGRLGGYEILELIGRGGMGIVFKGRDRKLERLVAVKVLSPELASSATARKRFLREAQAAAAVTHEHVVTIHAVEEADGTPFLVMEYIVGVSLEDRIQHSGHLRVEEILRIGMQAASGLAAAHAQGLVHRDIKPSNILLENGVERVKITDFGLARVIHEAQSTQSNVVAGTPPYMSPEHARGENVDHRSDLFSLGSVLYAMCTGRSPFRAETPTGAIHRVCNDTPRSIREINPEIPDWLVAVIDRLLAKKPEDRFQSATEVADVLGQYLAHAQQPSQVALPSDRWRRAKTRHGPSLWPSLAAAGVVMALVLLALAAVRQWFVEKDRFTFVDLALAANCGLTECPGGGEDHFGELKPGILKVGDVPFQVTPRFIQLAGERVPGCPPRVQGIGVNGHAAKVHVLHGTKWTHPGRTTKIAVYRFNYEDGTSVTMPVIAQRHLRNWWKIGALPELATRAQVAWTGMNPVSAKRGVPIQVFICTFENPHPDKTIATIDFERGADTLPAPFCLGITCDQDATPLPEEPGLAIVSISKSMGLGRYSVVIGSSNVPPLKGNGQHFVLLPAGRHSLEIRDGDIVVRRGSIDVTQGSIAFVTLDAQSTWLALPTPQPNPRSELTGQYWGVNACAMSHDGQMLATAAGDGTVVLWRLDRGSWIKQATLDVHILRVSSVAFCPTAPLLASASDDGTVRLWDAASAVLLATLKADERKVSAVTFSPDGKTVASGNDDGTVDLWNVATRKSLATLAAHSGTVAGLAFSPDGTTLATSSWAEENAKVWDVASREVKQVLSGHTDKIGSVAFSPNGKTIASASSDTTVRLWDAETGQPIGSFENPDRVFAVAFSPDGKRLAAGGLFQTIRIWDLSSREVVHDFLAHWGEVRSLVFAPDGATLITSSWDNITRVWSVGDLPGPFGDASKGPRPRYTLKVWGDWVVWAAFAPKAGGDKLAAVPLMGDCRVYDLRDWTSTTFQAYKNEPGAPFGWMCQDSLHFTPDGEGFVTCVTRKNQPQIGFWQMPDYRLRNKFEPSPVPSREFAAWDTRMALSHDGAIVAIASPQQSRVSTADVAAASPRWSVPLQNDWPSSIHFSPDDQTIAVGTNSGRVLLLDARTGKNVHQPLVHGTGLVTDVKFSPDGAILISVGKDGVVKIWTLSKYQSEALPTGHDEKVLSAEFSPDGKLLVTTGGGWVADKDILKRQGEVCLWDVAAKTLQTKFTAHHGCVTCGVFSPDGKSLATTGRDGKMHLWDVEELLKWQEKKAAQ